MPKLNVFLRIALKMICLLLILALIGTALLWIVFSFPDDRMRANLSESATNRNFLCNLAYEYIIDGQILSFTDNVIDARLLMSACNWETDTKTALERAMISAFPNVNGVMFRTQSLNEIFGKGQTDYTLYPYARYWHGIQIVMRPLLFFFTYPEIVTLNGLVQALLLCIVLVLLTKRGLSREAIAFGVALMCVGAYIFSASLSLSICYYILLFSMIILLVKHEWLLQGNRYLFFFFGIGISTAYFDTLTWPAITFGVPVILYALLTTSADIKKRIQTVVSFAASWFFGYLGFWALKWPIASVVTGESIMESVTSNISIHTFGNPSFSGKEITLVNSLKKLIYPYNTTVMRLFLLICFVLLVVSAILFFRRVRSKEIRRVYFCRILTLVFVCFIPFVWYSILQSHSTVHNLNYPNRLMLMTLWSGMCMFIQLFAAAAGQRGQETVSKNDPQPEQ